MGDTLADPPPSGRILRVVAGDVASWAFVPDPLPPAPSLLSVAETAPALAAAERALHDLVALSHDIDRSGLLTRLQVRRESVASQRLEGSRVTITDVYAYEAGPLPALGLPAAPESDVRAVLNHERALMIGMERARAATIRLATLSEVHEELLEGVRGVQAAPGVYRGGGGQGPRLVYAPLLAPPASELAPALDALAHYLEAGESEPPLVRAALVHYQFLALHPFHDGSAQLARLLPALVLARSGDAAAPLLGVSASIMQRLEGYHEALRGVTEQGDWTGWVRYFLEMVTTAAEDTATRLRLLSELWERWRARVAPARSSEVLLQLVDSLFASPFVTFPLAQQVLGGNYRAARFAVQRLTAEGIVQPATGDAFRKVFVAGGVLELLEEGR